MTNAATRKTAAAKPEKKARPAAAVDQQTMLQPDENVAPADGGDVGAEGVAAVDRALAIVTALEQSSAAVTLSELSRLTGLYKSTLLRLLISLERSALVLHRGDGRYVLGPFCARLGRAFNASNQLQEYVVPVLERLVAQGTESSSFHVRYDDRLRLCLFRVDSHHSTLDSVRAGDLMPLAAGAPAKVIKYYHGNDNLQNRDTDAQLVFFSYGERNPSCAAVAGPVFGPGGQFVGALSLSGPKERFTDETVKTMTDLLTVESRQLTVALGGTWPARLPAGKK